MKVRIRLTAVVIRARTKATTAREDSCDGRLQPRTRKFLHGPHNVRDVLATHILKQTGSYEQASYAIQDTPDMVAKHYGRFLPQDKAALAAQILNRVWEAA